MSRLTNGRLAAARPILDRYLDKLRRDRFYSAFALERESADLWRLGYQELSGAVTDLLDAPRDRLVAVYHLENVGADAGSPRGRRCAGSSGLSRARRVSGAARADAAAWRAASGRGRPNTRSRPAEAAARRTRSRTSRRSKIRASASSSVLRIRVR
ncbi:MAG TPA: hypothetical protein VF170_15755, partial [Planctomycetaceae bacterium]